MFQFFYFSLSDVYVYVKVLITNYREHLKILFFVSTNFFLVRKHILLFFEEGGPGGGVVISITLFFLFRYPQVYWFPNNKFKIFRPKSKPQIVWKLHSSIWHQKSDSLHSKLDSEYLFPLASEVSPRKDIRIYLGFEVYCLAFKVEFRYNFFYLFFSS